MKKQHGWKLSKQLHIVYVGIVLLVVLFEAAFLYGVYAAKMEQQKIAAEMQGNYIIAAFQEELTRCKETTVLLKDLYHVYGNAFLSDFRFICGQLAQDNLAIGSMYFAPHGLIQYAYPEEVTESTMLFNMLKDPVQSPKAKQALMTKVPTIAGPHHLVEGGTGIIIRTPVFTNDRFDGFTILCIDTEELLHQVDERLSDEVKTYSFAIWTYDSTVVTDEQGYILHSKTIPSGREVVIPFEVPNDTWYLTVEPIGGWHTDVFSTREFAVSLVLVIMVLGAIYLLFRNFENEKRIALQEQTKESRKELDFRYRILEGLSQDFQDIFLLDLEGNTSRTLKLHGNMLSFDDVRINNYSAKWREVVRKIVDEQELEKVLTFSNRDNLLEALNTEQELNITFPIHMNGDHYYEAKFVKLPEGEDGKVYVILGMRLVDNIIMEEQKRVQEENQKNTIIQSITEIYFSIYRVNVQTDSFTMVRTTPVIQRIAEQHTGAKECLRAISDGLLDGVPEDRIVSFCNTDNWTEWLKNTNSVYREYKSHVTGYIRVNLIVAERDENGNASEVLVALQDVNEITLRYLKDQEELQRAKDAAEAANAAKTSFLFHMSHDIRTPMNAIIGFTDLLRKYQDSPEKRNDYLTKIRDSSDVLLSIINNVLEMARIERGNVSLDETPMDAVVFNDALFSDFADMMSRKGITFTRDIHVEHKYIYADQVKLREVFQNLISNAYKYTEPNGTVHMEVIELPTEDPNYVQYRTRILDTGIGMSKEFIPHIYDEFSREQTTTEAKIEGTGLGMPIVKRLLDLMGATITVNSQVGCGTEFIVTITHRIADENVLNTDEINQPMQDTPSGKRILLAEDNDLNAEIAMAILEEVGWNIDRAEDGKQCIAMLEQAPDHYYDLILMDIQMPNCNGYEATKAIRKMDNTRKANIPIIAMTANAFEEDKRNALEAGMNAHVAKPINIAALMREIKNYLH